MVTILYAKYLKRVIDFAAALFLLIFLSPLLLLIALLVRVKLGSPVLFTQKRVGYKERIFEIKKFRTMTDERDANGNLLPDPVRLTKFGNLLRRTSLDELPELINILKGDMAFVGPRPLLVPFLKLYTKEQHKRHNVRPGLTCIDSVKGRNTVPWIERLKMDTYYAEHVSVKLDLEILFKTVGVVLLQKGSPDASGCERESIYIVLANQNKDE